MNISKAGEGVLMLSNILNYPKNSNWYFFLIKNGFTH